MIGSFQEEEQAEIEKTTQQLREGILQCIDLQRDLTDEELLKIIRDRVLSYASEVPMDLETRKQVERQIFYSLRRLDVLQDLLEDDSITEIMVNGPDAIFIERSGHISQSPRHFSSKEKLDDVIQTLVGAVNKMANEVHPIVDTRWTDGSRINIVLPPIALDGSIITVRRFPKEPITMERLIKFGSLNSEMADLLKELVIAGYNIYISGGTGSGKTTLLNALTEFIPQGERVITIEEAAELQVIGVDNLVRLEAREASLEGTLEISIRDLVRTSLRMRPDRIIVGECRGAEALEILTVANTGHDGTMSTGHGNSTRDMISRLETMTLMADVSLPLAAIRKQIAGGIDVFVHLGRMRDGSRKVLEIAEVDGMEGDEVKLRTLYEYVEGTGIEGGEAQWRKRNDLYHREKLQRAGF